MYMFWLQIVFFFSAMQHNCRATLWYVWYDRGDLWFRSLRNILDGFLHSCGDRAGIEIDMTSTTLIVNVIAYTSFVLNYHLKHLSYLHYILLSQIYIRVIVRHHLRKYIYSWYSELSNLRWDLASQILTQLGRRIKGELLYPVELFWYTALTRDIKRVTIDTIDKTCNVLCDRRLRFASLAGAGARSRRLFDYRKLALCSWKHSLSLSLYSHRPSLPTADSSENRQMALPS